MTRLQELPSYSDILDELKNGKKEEQVIDADAQKQDLMEQFNKSVRG